MEEAREQASAHPLDDFCAALGQRCWELTPRMCATLVEAFPALSAMPYEEMRLSCAAGFWSYVTALRAPGFAELRAYWVSVNEALVLVGGRRGPAARSQEEGRRAMLEVALGLLEEGVPGAREGVLRLMETFDVVQDVTAAILQEKAEVDVEVSARLLRRFAEVCPEATAVGAQEDVVNLVNGPLEALVGKIATGRSFTSLLVPEDEGRWQGAREEMRTQRSWRGRLRLAGAGGREVPADVVAFRVDTESGGQMFCWLLRDVSGLLEAEEARAVLQSEVIAAQGDAIRELMTPLLPLAEGVVAMPIVGAIDGARGARILEVLLAGIAARQARVAIVDITGVSRVDAEVAAGLSRAARAARLLGTEVIVTGLRGAVAQTLVSLDVRLDEVTTCGTLQEGVARAFGGAFRRG